jgi:Transposase
MTTKSGTDSPFGVELASFRMIMTTYGVSPGVRTYLAYTFPLVFRPRFGLAHHRDSAQFPGGLRHHRAVRRAAVKELAGSGSVRWAIDLNSGGAALLITVLLHDGQDLLYIPGRTVHHASGAYRGDGTTDAKDATIIADQARMRKDLHQFRHRDKAAVDLRILCARRNDLASDRNRVINRLRAQLLEYFPALERAFDFAHRKGAHSADWLSDS